MITTRSFYIILLLCIITYLLGMVFIPLMDIDASQYASMSREMLENKSYLQVFDLGVDYLDKPPMLFWLSALSMKIFGVHDWAYRLPSFFFAILAVYATYKLASIFYKKEIAQLSAMVLASSQALFLITHDVRCDTMLMGWVTLSLWQMAAWYQNGKWKHFLIAFIAIACGMMTKGPIALLIPAFSFVPHFLLRREWKQLFRWEYIVGVLIIGVMLIPMSIGLYQQFDLHPGKLINGEPIQSGLRFYYWTQSFGRYTGENHFNEMNHFTFLLENMVWSFLPWFFLFAVGLCFAVKDLVKKRLHLSSKDEWITTGGFIITYCILARSQAQLPHYIFVVYPLAAIVTANFLYNVLFTDAFIWWRKQLLNFHTGILAFLWLLCIALIIWSFKIPLFISILACSCLVIYFIILFSKRPVMPVLLQLAFFTVIGMNVLLSTVFYPNVLKYQLGNDAAAFMDQQKIDKKQVRIYGIHEGRALHFYGKYIFSEKRSLAELQPTDIVITAKDSIAVFQNNFPGVKVLHEGAAFGVTALSSLFLNPATRDKETPKYVILELGNRR